MLLAIILCRAYHVVHHGKRGNIGVAAAFAVFDLILKVVELLVVM